MPKILSQSGITLADQYDVEGSVAGVEDLNSQDVSLTHDMASVLQAERMCGDIFRLSTGALAQTIIINSVMVGLPNFPTRIHQIAVVNFNKDSGTRLTDLSINIRDANQSAEVPAWVWAGTTIDGRISNLAGATANCEFLVPNPALSVIPSMLYGSSQPQVVENFAMRGLTTTFGAGTVELVLMVYLGFNAQKAVSSAGVPVPSW